MNPAGPLKNTFPAWSSRAIKRDFLAYQLPWTFSEDTMERWVNFSKRGPIIFYKEQQTLKAHRNHIVCDSTRNNWTVPFLSHLSSKRGLGQENNHQNNRHEQASKDKFDLEILFCQRYSLPDASFHLASEFISYVLKKRHDFLHKELN
jgi:hypothetical protein